MTTVAVPGQIVGNTSTHAAGPGTHIFENNIIASISGSATATPSQVKSEKPVVSIPRHTTRLTTSSTSISLSGNLPSVNSIVLCRVTRVQQRQLNASILVVNPSTSDFVSYTSQTNDDLQFQAILRKEDVRAYEKDKIQMNEMYRVGDVVRATVISLGDERNYYLSTAGNELGVVVAISEDGNAMVPASWKEMRDVITGKGESRKVAKPV